ncbi:hypothetical protein M6D93_03740 [Jatrophihabitans telluris]|uniref:Lipoprotein n=1 Tax=Jatrophihabitans telluris TaxID=2038343 RepID=A0ABY4QZX9_9ACTN|nr:hypothetical protein [Jatrophihabitans telluris]UQX89120.1 hypothetical protein M6D93_03740 [Jatrophihabitans telluris]
MTTRRPRRVLFAATVTTALALAGCAKHQPAATINVSDGNSSAVIKAQNVCVVAGSCELEQAKVADLTAKAGTTILVGVTKDLADAGWVAAAYTQTGKTNTAIPGAGTTGVSNNLATRLAVPASKGGYFLQFTSLKPSNRLTTWVVRVTIGS